MEVHSTPPNNTTDMQNNLLIIVRKLDLQHYEEETFLMDSLTSHVNDFDLWCHIAHGFKLNSRTVNDIAWGFEVI